MGRRKFIANTAKVGLGLTVLPSILQAKENDGVIVNFKQKPLSYSYNDLEPYIDAATMEIHYTKHAAGYTKNLNEAMIAEYKQKNTPTIEEILANISKYSIKMRNNAGGHYNHELFWQILSPKSSGKPSDKMLEVINKFYGTLEEFKKQFTQAATSRFGSGWAWLIEENGGLKIVSTPNQDNPLMDVAELKGNPILGLDVWEHAYYLKYQNKRADYIKNWWNIINWDAVEKKYFNKK